MKGNGPVTAKGTLKTVDETNELSHDHLRE
jgi:hypothetical protein